MKLSYNSQKSRIRKFNAEILNLDHEINTKVKCKY